jgi:hypothetical protein
MKAIAVYPGKPHSMHLEDMPMPKITDIPDGKGVLVKVLRVGVDGTDKEAIKVYIEVARNVGMPQQGGVCPRPVEASLFRKDDEKESEQHIV